MSMNSGESDKKKSTRGSCTNFGSCYQELNWLHLIDDSKTNKKIATQKKNVEIVEKE